jgi:histidinol-phosphate aminotransferase
MAESLLEDEPMKIRELFGHFEEYGWETPSWEIAAKVGLPVSMVVRLDTNTSPFRPESALRDLGLALGGLEVNEYPDTSYLALREALSGYTGKGLERFVVTNGADEGLDIATKVFIDPGDEVVIPTPTYAMYGITSSIMGASVVSVPRRRDFGLDVEAILAAVTGKTKVIFLCNPNNPTGDCAPTEEVERLATESGVAVVIDEAYFEYCGKSTIDLSDRLENIIVCRTLSKAFSMAGVRIGYLVAGAETVSKLNAVRPPNSLSVVSLFLGKASLAHRDEMERNVRSTVEEREKLLHRLRGINGIEPYPSQTNFILFRVVDGDADALHARLMSKGLVLRNLSKRKGVENCLRTTVSTPEINERLAGELESALARRPER